MDWALALTAMNIPEVPDSGTFLHVQQVFDLNGLGDGNSWSYKHSLIIREVSPHTTWGDVHSKFMRMLSKEMVATIFHDIYVHRQ
jgi:hypothetical protein